MVKRNTLLLLACLVWSAAGFNILRIGLSAYPAYRAHQRLRGETPFLPKVF